MNKFTLLNEMSVNCVCKEFETNKVSVSAFNCKGKKLEDNYLL